MSYEWLDIRTLKIILAPQKKINIITVFGFICFLKALLSLSLSTVLPRPFSNTYNCISLQYFSGKSLLLACFLQALCSSHSSWRSLILFGYLFYSIKYFPSDHLSLSPICWWGLIFVQFAWSGSQYTFRTSFPSRFGPVKFYEFDSWGQTFLTMMSYSRRSLWMFGLPLLTDRT